MEQALCRLVLLESPDHETAVQFHEMVMEVEPAHVPEDMKRAVHYIQQMSQAAIGHLIGLTVALIVNIAIGIPLNLLTIFTIMKTRELWTHVNTIMAINCFVQVFDSIVAVTAAVSLLADFFGHFNGYTRHIFIVQWWTGAFGRFADNTR